MCHAFLHMTMTMPRDGRVEKRKSRVDKMPSCWAVERMMGTSRPHWCCAKKTSSAVNRLIVIPVGIQRGHSWESSDTVQTQSAMPGELAESAVNPPTS